MKRRDLIKKLESNGWWFLRSGGKQIAKLALVTAIVTLATSIITLLTTLVSWLTGK